VEEDDDGVSAMAEVQSGTGRQETVGLQEAIEFVWLEADLLDNRDYAAWLGLWTEGGRYVIPIDPDGEDLAANLNIAYDDKTMREARVNRLCSGHAMSAAPAARTVRTVSRFRVIATGAGSIELRCAQHLVEYKHDRTRLLAAQVSYRLVRGTTGLALDEKVVKLINSDDALFGIGYLP
jgi:3-phenylpropionate/cinnamic acid dioxygenase small subunit